MRVRLATLVGVAALALAGCGVEVTPEGAPPASSATAAPSTAESQATRGTEPSPQPSRSWNVPRAFPILTEEIDTAGYLRTMFDIHTASTRNLQPHEDSPRLVRVAGVQDCVQQRGTVRLGDTAKPAKGKKPLLMAACIQSGRPVVKFAPHRVYDTYRNVLRDDVEAAIRDTYRAYLVLLIYKRTGNTDRLVDACAAGRVVGGLRLKSYLMPYKAESLVVEPNDHSEWATTYRTARDKGSCASRLLGRV